MKLGLVTWGLNVSVSIMGLCFFLTFQTQIFTHPFFFVKNKALNNILAIYCYDLLIIGGDQLFDSKIFVGLSYFDLSY